MTFRGCYDPRRFRAVLAMSPTLQPLRRCVVVPLECRRNSRTRSGAVGPSSQYGDDYVFWTAPVLQKRIPWRAAPSIRAMVIAGGGRSGLLRGPDTRQGDIVFQARYRMTKPWITSAAVRVSSMSAQTYGISMLGPRLQKAAGPGWSSNLHGQTG
jgi:hypothetical protein